MVHSYVLENSGHQVDLYGPKILIHTHELVFIFLLESKQTHSVSLPTNTELVGLVTVEHPPDHLEIESFTEIADLTMKTMFSS